VLFLNKGVWNEKQIISEQWIAESAKTFVDNVRWGSGYSLLWWIHEFELRSGDRLSMFYACGWGGQYIMVLPELKTVVVFTAANFQTERPAINILEKYILPSIY